MNRTVTVHDAPGARAVPEHVSDPATMLNVKFRLTGATATFVTWVDVPPAGDAFVRVTTPVPLRDPVGSVIVSGFGEIETVARVATLMPVRATGVGVTVSPVDATVRVRLYVPAVAGAVKTTLTVQLAPTASVPAVVHVPPAVPVGLENGCGVPPPSVAVIPVVVAILPVLVTVSVWALLAVPVNQLPNNRGLGETVNVLTAGTPFPVSVTGDPLTVTFEVTAADPV